MLLTIGRQYTRDSLESAILHYKSGVLQNIVIVETIQSLDFSQVSKYKQCYSKHLKPFAHLSRS